MHRGALAADKRERQWIHTWELSKVSFFRLLENSRPRIGASDCLNTVTPAPRIAQTIWAVQVAALFPRIGAGDR